MTDYDRLGEEINSQDFDHPFSIVDGRVADALAEVYAPSVYHDEDSDINIDGDDAWTAISGMTGQYGYNGSVMHPSEFIGASMARELAGIAEDGHGVVFAVVTVESIDGDEEDGTDEAIGWTVVYRDTALVEITTHVTEYVWPDGPADEPERTERGSETDVVELAEVPRWLRDAGVIQASSSPYGGLNTWYADEAYSHPYTAAITEKTFHLSGVTDAQAREIYRAVIGR